MFWDFYPWGNCEQHDITHAKVSHVQPTCQPNLHITNIEVVVNCKTLNFLIQLFVKPTKCDECKLGWQVSMSLTFYPWRKVSDH